MEPAAPPAAALGSAPLALNRRGLLACSALGAMVVAAFLIAAGSAGSATSPLLHIHDHGFIPTDLRGPLAGLDLSAGRGDAIALLTVLCAGYLAVLAYAESVPARLGLATVVALHLIFALAPPLLSSDVFNYLGYARLDLLHHLNPYGNPLTDRPGDAAYMLTGWRLNTTAYGPLFTLITIPVASLGLSASMWALKAITAAASLGCVALVWACAKQRGLPPLPHTLFFGLNPILLVYVVGGAHNDALMVLLTLTGVWALLVGREAGAAAIVGAAAIKLSALIVLPFALLGAERRSRGLLWASIAIVVAVAVALLSFGTSVFSLLGVLHGDARIATPNEIPRMATGALGLEVGPEARRVIGMAIFAAAFAFLLMRVRRGSDWLDSAGWAVFALLATITDFMPWYLVWFLPFAALSRRSGQRIAALVLTLLVVAVQATHNL